MIQRVQKQVGKEANHANHAVTASEQINRQRCETSISKPLRNVFDVLCQPKHLMNDDNAWKRPRTFWAGIVGIKRFVSGGEGQRSRHEWGAPGIMAMSVTDCYDRTHPPCGGVLNPGSRFEARQYRCLASAIGIVAHSSHLRPLENPNSSGLICPREPHQRSQPLAIPQSRYRNSPPLFVR